MRLLFGILILFITLIYGCSEEKSKNTDLAAADKHTSQNSLDWQGTYFGILPCASCEGIETQITLSDSTYKLSLSYLGEDTSGSFTQTDFFRWNEAGNTITLDNREAPNQYFVGENKLIHLNQNGERITGDLARKYHLSKITVSSE
jgi:uncharacterized lipoprotein NlpE involved in copper resistance